MTNITGGVKFFHRLHNPDTSRITVVNSTTGDTTQDATVSKLNMLFGTDEFANICPLDGLSTITFTLSWNNPVHITSLLLTNLNSDNFAFETTPDINDDSAVTFNNEDFRSKDSIGQRITHDISNKKDLYIQFDLLSVSEITFVLGRTNINSKRQQLGGLYIMDQLGTLTGYPTTTVRFTNNERRVKTLNERQLINKKLRTATIDLSFRNYPFDNDINLVADIIARRGPFVYIYPCGGRAGNDYFKVTPEGFRPGDIYKVEPTGNLSNSWQRNTYLNGTNAKIRFGEIL